MQIQRIKMKRSAKSYHWSWKSQRLWIIITGLILVLNGIAISANNFKSVYHPSLPTVLPTALPTAAADDPQLVVYFFYNIGCPLCIEKQIIMLNFNDTHPSIEYIEKRVYCGFLDEEAFSEAFFSDYPDNIIGVPNPSVVFTIEGSSCRYLLLEDYITPEILETVYLQLLSSPNSCQGWITYGEFNPWIAFVTGLISGISPCIILMTGVLGSSFFSTISNKKFILGMIGFIAGVLLAYLGIGILFTTVYDFASVFFSSILLKLIVGIPLILLGAWMCLDAFNENSRLFKTPDKMKKMFKDLAEKGTVVSTLLLGLAFTLVKSPCIASIMLSLLLKVTTLGSNFGLIISSVLLFCIGVILPIIIIFGLMKWGISSEKINEKRMRFRPYLRLITGILIITITLWSLW